MKTEAVVTNVQAVVMKIEAMPTAGCAYATNVQAVVMKIKAVVTNVQAVVIYKL